MSIDTCSYLCCPTISPYDCSIHMFVSVSHRHVVWDNLYIWVIDPQDLFFAVGDVARSLVKTYGFFLISQHIFVSFGNKNISVVMERTVRIWLQGRCLMLRSSAILPRYHHKLLQARVLHHHHKRVHPPSERGDRVAAPAV